MPAMTATIATAKAPIGTINGELNASMVLSPFRLH
jgi:hypothetical protein